MGNRTMTLNSRSLTAWVGIVLAVFVAPAARGQTSSPDDLLKSKGLTRQGTYYLLDTDINLPAGLRTMRQAKKLLDDNARKRSQIQAEIKDAKTTLASLDQRYRQVLAAITPGLPDEKHNQLVGQGKT